jgi:hypothetical protein
VGDGRLVAVDSRVGGGVLIGGSGVNVGTSVGGSSDARVRATGWNGVEVGRAFGSGVTNTSGARGGRAVAAAGRRQASRRQADNRHTTTRFFVISNFWGSGGLIQPVYAPAGLNAIS